MRGAGVKARAQQLPSGQRAHAVSRVMTVWLAHEEDSGGVWPHLQAVKWSLQAFREVMRLTRREFPLSKVILMETLEYLLRLAQRGDGRRCTQWALQCLFHDVPKRNQNFDNIFCIETPRENKHGPLSSSIIPRTHWRGRIQQLTNCCCVWLAATLYPSLFDLMEKMWSSRGYDVLNV